MGPQRFSCGNPGRGSSERSTGRLQWGRSVSAAETGAEILSRLTRDPLQWGRSVSAAETGAQPAVSPTRALASMGPQRFSCGNRRSASDGACGAQRFNGAAAFQLRKQGCDPMLIQRYLALQWGRSVSAAETVNNRGVWTNERWLQWGRSVSAAETGSGREVHKESFVASMGPQRFSCGNNLE